MSERITLILNQDNHRVTEGYEVVTDPVVKRFQAINPENDKQIVVWWEEDGERKTQTVDMPWRWSVLKDLTEETADYITTLHSWYRSSKKENLELETMKTKAQEWLTEYLLGSMDKDQAIAEMDELMDILEVERSQEVQVTVTATWSGYVEVSLGEEFDESKIQLASDRLEVEYEDYHFYEPDIEVTED